MVNTHVISYNEVYFTVQYSYGLISTLSRKESLGSLQPPSQMRKLATTDRAGRGQEARQPRLQGATGRGDRTRWTGHINAGRVCTLTRQSQYL